MIIQVVLATLWIAIFAMLCSGVKRSLRRRSRENRIDQIRAIRRFTHGNHVSRRQHRAPAMQAAA